jgi:DNA-binding NarL/FixJ family response regulator
MPKRIVIIDDDETSRFLYRYYFQSVSDIEIIAEFDNAEEALPQIPQLKPDVVIVDYTLPGMSGIELADRLNQYTEMKVLLVTGHERDSLNSALKCSPTFEFFLKDWSDRTMERIINFVLKTDDVSDAAAN